MKKLTPAERCTQNKINVVKRLSQSHATLNMLADDLDINVKTMAYYIKLLIAENRIHIASWTEQINNRVTWVKIYSSGEGSGDTPEKPLTPKSVIAKRTYERNKSGISVYDKAELSEAEIFARKPVNFVPVKQSWFSALEWTA